MSARRARATDAIRLVDADPELLGDRPELHPLGSHDLHVTELATGTLAQQRGAPSPRLGQLIIDGLLARRVTFAGRRRAELLGPGDLIRPFDVGMQPAAAVEWHVVGPARLATLDDVFLCRAASYPDLLVALTLRGVERAHRLATQMALTDARPVSERLLALFTFLADHWGRTTHEGAIFTGEMSHQLVAEMAGASRPTVTSALRRLHARGELIRVDDRTWLVRARVAMSPR